MKSLIKKRKVAFASDSRTQRQAPAQQEKVAQCCAKVSKAVAGCHD